MAAFQRREGVAQPLQGLRVTAQQPDPATNRLPSSALHRPGPRGEGPGFHFLRTAAWVPMHIWISEADKDVWHLAASRLGALRYRAACDWELDVRQGRAWPQKPTEPGPAADRRCHTCVTRAGWP